jgi:hypothetical protein
MPKSRMSRMIALLALLTVALMLAIAGQPGDGFISGEDGVEVQATIEHQVHFGW